MKVQLSGKNKNGGFATLEILVAFAIILLCMGAVILITFGNQSVSVDSQTNIEATYKAQAILENARALSRQDFTSLVSTTSISTSGIPYTQTLSITDLTPCKKQATSTVTWLSSSRPQKIEFSTFFIDTLGALAFGGDCDSTPPSGDWSHPLEKSGLNIDKATGIDVEYHLAFLTLNKTPASSDDLAIVDVTSSTTPILLSHVDVFNKQGFNAIDVATSTDGRLYAYIANNDPVGQLLIMDVTVPTAPFFVASSSLPGISTGVGRSIFYYDKKVYIGTSYFVCGGCKELHIYDVTTPSSPTHVGSIDVNRNVNAIYVRNGIAYVATGPGTSPLHNPLKIFDVDPTHISPNPITTYLQQIGSFTATGDEEGTALYNVGNNLYLGLERATGGRPDFYVLNVSTPGAITTFGSKNLAMNPGSKVVGIRVSSNFGFIGTSDPNENLLIKDVGRSTIDPIGSFNFAQTTTGMDLADNTVYLSSFSGSRSLEIVGPTP